MNRSLRRALSRAAVGDSPAATIVGPLVQQGAAIERNSSVQSRDYVELSARTVGSSGASGPASGDLSGAYPSPTVATIAGQPVASVIFTSTALGGALSGTLPNPSFNSGAAAAGRVLTANGSGAATWAEPSGGDAFAFMMSG